MNKNSPEQQQAQENADAAQEAAKAPAPMPPQTIKAVIMPLDLFNRVHDALREAPHRHVDHVLKECATLQVNDVNIGPRQ